MRTALQLVAAMAAMSFAACDCGDSEEDPASAAAEEDDALRAAAIAREIRAAPDDTEAILERHGLTIEEFEALMYDIAADPEASQRYETALSASVE
jgi:hypothetical protein